jgi:hypothetical protein
MIEARTVHSGVLEGQQLRHLGTKVQGRRRSEGERRVAIPNRSRYIPARNHAYMQTQKPAGKFGFFFILVDA